MADTEVKRLIEAIEKTPVSSKCPSCQGEAWTPLGSIANIPIDPAPTTIRALGLACDRCGLVRLHAAQVLDQYMDPRNH